MTDTLRDLLRESVTGVEMPDAAPTAWAAARRARRRRAVGSGVIVVAVVAGVGGVVRLADRDAGSGAASPAHRPSPSAAAHSPSAAPSPSPTDRRSPHLGGPEPDRTVAGVGRVWWGPDLAQEAALPQWASVVPPRIDLSAAAPGDDDHPVFRAMAAFAVFDRSGVERVVVMTQGGSLRSVDVARLRKVVEGDGNAFYPETRSMLSPTGEYLMFPQQGHLEVFRLSTGQWRSVDTGSSTTVDATWSSDTDILLPQHGRSSRGPTYDVITGRRSGSFGDSALILPGDRGHANPYGRQREGVVGDARSYDVPPGLVPVRPGSLDMLQVLVVRRWDGATGRDVLSFTSRVDAARQKECCSVVGWLDDGPVVYESLGAPSRLIAWRVGTHEFGRVATITGVTAGKEHYVSSWARLWDRWPTG